jgi:hypothetical protein
MENRPESRDMMSRGAEPVSACDPCAEVRWIVMPAKQRFSQEWLREGRE